MKSSSKPARGCQSFGFTFLDANGNMVQISWAGLKERGEGLFVFDGSRWRRLRHPEDAAKFGDSLRFAIAPLAASAEAMDALAVVLPSGFLSGQGAERVDRIRRLADVHPALLQISNLYRGLSTEDQEALAALRADSSLSDRDLLERLSSRTGESAGVTALTAALNVSLLRRGSGVYGETTDILDGSLAGVDRRVIAEFLNAHASRFNPLDGQYTNVMLLLAEFADAEDPFAAALSATYGLPVGPHAQMATALRFLSTLSVTPETADILAGEAGQDADPLLVDLVALALVRSGGDPDSARSAMERFRQDPDAALLELGSPELLVSRRFPQLSTIQQNTLASLMGFASLDPVSEEALAVLDRFDPDVFSRVMQLVADAPGGQFEGNLDFAVRAVAVFGDRAPDWLMRAASAPEIDRQRLLARLPDADATVRRVNQLRETLEAPEPTEEDRNRASRTVEQLAPLADSMRRGEHGARLLALADAINDGGEAAGSKFLLGVTDDTSLLALLAPAGEHSELIRAIEERRVRDGSLDAESLRDLEFLRSLPAAFAESPAAAAALVRGYLAAGGSATYALRRLPGDIATLGRSEIEASRTGSSSALRAVAQDEATLLALLPSGSAAVKRVKQIQALLADPGCADRAVLERELALLDTFGLALKQGRRDDALTIARASLEDDEVALRILPRRKSVEQQIGSLRQLAEGREDAAARRASLERDLASWVRYSEAMLAGDEDELLRVGAEIFPDREAGARLSVHDALFWLPSDPRLATAPDGSSLGDWLLKDGRGVAALRTENGRRSLNNAVGGWVSLGRAQAQVKELSDEVLSREYGGYDDPYSRFFMRERIGKPAAATTLQTVRSTQEVPTPFPMDRVFLDEATGLRGYFLPRTDVRGMNLGVLTDCCQSIGGAGQSCAFAGQSHPASGFFVVEDSEGTVLAQSWVWASTNADGSLSGAIFDNVEARLSGASPERVNSVRQVYEGAADALAARFDAVFVGGHNDIPLTDLPPRSAGDASGEYLLASAIGYSGYLGDSTTQRLWRRAEPGAEGVRYRGLPDGFLMEQGDLTVKVHADGTLECSAPAALEMARRELASSTVRSYRALGADGSLLEEFTTGAKPEFALNHDLSLAPQTYDEFSPELIARAVAAGVPEGSVAQYLGLASGDVHLAATLAASDWSYPELLSLKVRGRGLPAMPEGIAELDPSDPRRAVFLHLHERRPELAHVVASSSEIFEKLHSVRTPDGVPVLLRPGSLDAVSEVLPALLRREDFAMTAGLVLEVLESQSGFGVNNHAAPLRIARGVAEMIDAGLYPNEVESLARATVTSDIRREISVVSDPELRREIIALEPQERDKLSRTVQILHGAQANTNFATAMALKDEDSYEVVFPAVRLDKENPLLAAHVLAGAGSEGEEGSTESRDAVLARYNGIKRLLERPSGSEPEEEITEDTMRALLEVDVDRVVENTRVVGISETFGEHMPPFLYSPEGMKALAEVPDETFRRLGQTFNWFGATTKDLVYFVSAGLEAADLGVLAGEERIDATAVQAARLRGLPADSLAVLARSGVSAPLFKAALRHGDVCDAVLTGKDRDVLEPLVRWAGSAERSGDAHFVGYLMQIASSSLEARARVLEAVRPFEDDDPLGGNRVRFLSFRKVLAELEDIAPVPEILGGIAPDPNTFV